MIELRGLTKSFGKRVVLDELDLRIDNGEMVSIMGHSGSGKTTMLNILGFLDTQTSGEYLFNGKVIKRNYHRNRIRNEYMGFVFQSYNLIPRLTVFENIALPIYYSHNQKLRSERLKKIPELIKQFGLELIKSSYVDYISGGEKQRVCLARSLACGANLIISDEPTGNLDAVNTELILEQFKRLNNEGKTIIIVTHDKNVEAIAHTNYHLIDGKLRATSCLDLV